MSRYAGADHQGCLLRVFRHWAPGPRIRPVARLDAGQFHSVGGRDVHWAHPHAQRAPASRIRGGVLSGECAPRAPLVRLPRSLPSRARRERIPKGVEGGEERNTGAETRAAAGGARAHAGADVDADADAGAGADAEGSLYGTSAGVGPLLPRKTTIEWTIVGGKCDKTLRIPGCRAGTGRAALGHPAQPTGAAATAPGMSGPPGRAAAGAHDTKGVSRRGSTSARSGGPGPGGSSGPRGGGGTPGVDPRYGRGTGGGGGPPAEGGMGVPLGPWGLYLNAIIATAAAATATAATQGYAVAVAVAVAASAAASAPLASVLSPLKLLHLRFICRLATDAEIPRICLEVCPEHTKVAALLVLYQYLWAGREV